MNAAAKITYHLKIRYELKSNRSLEAFGAGVSFSGPDDSRAGNLHLHGLRVAVTAADNLDIEGRVLAKNIASVPDYYYDETKAAAHSTETAAAGHCQNR